MSVLSSLFFSFIINDFFCWMVTSGPLLVISLSSYSSLPSFYTKLTLPAHQLSPSHLRTHDNVKFAEYVFGSLRGLSWLHTTTPRPLGWTAHHSHRFCESNLVPFPPSRFGFRFAPPPWLNFTLFTGETLPPTKRRTANFLINPSPSSSAVCLIEGLDSPAF